MTDEEWATLAPIGDEVATAWREMMARDAGSPEYYRASTEYARALKALDKAADELGV